MRIQTFLLFALLSPANVALAQNPAARPNHAATSAVDPVGTYDLSFVSHGEPGIGVLIISGTAGSLKGILEAHGRSIPLTVTVAGRSVTLKDGADLTVTLTLEDGNTVKGRWSGHGESGELTGSRRP